ncbi:MAG: hypothetical protein JSW23_11795 [Planctomycetota bacterium]|nr:MAG: hypothetical protein JSW23_11795 [Planctomycetota bacterium]
MKLKPSHIIVSFFVILCCLLSFVYGQGQMSWDDDFSPISLSNIQTKNQVRQGQSTTTLSTTGDAEITADNSTSARLNGPGGDSLNTEYGLAFDGSGTSETGGSSVAFTSYDLFLSTPAYVTYVTGDNNVDVTLRVRASNYAGDVANAGTYTATQTLTVSWVGP